MKKFIILFFLLQLISFITAQVSYKVLLLDSSNTLKVKTHSQIKPIRMDLSDKQLGVDGFYFINNHLVTSKLLSSQDDNDLEILIDLYSFKKEKFYHSDSEIVFRRTSDGAILKIGERFYSKVDSIGNCLYKEIFKAFKSRYFGSDCYSGLGVSVDDGNKLQILYKDSTRILYSGQTTLTIPQFSSPILLNSHLIAFIYRDYGQYAYTEPCKVVVFDFKKKKTVREIATQNVFIIRKYNSKNIMIFEVLDDYLFSNYDNKRLYMYNIQTSKKIAVGMCIDAIAVY